MAKVKPITPLNVIEGGTETEHRPVSARGSEDWMASKNQHGAILCRKPKSARRRTEKQDLLRCRFAQLECMWKGMTRTQRALWSRYSKALNRTFGLNKRPFDHFKSLGMQYKLFYFLEDVMKLKLIAKVVIQKSDYVVISATYDGDEPVEWQPRIARFIRG